MLPEIPKTWLVAVIMTGLIILSFIGFNHWVQATLGLIVGYLLGQHGINLPNTEDK